jgi:hypothetical protein
MYIFTLKLLHINSELMYNSCNFHIGKKMHIGCKSESYNKQEHKATLVVQS